MELSAGLLSRLLRLVTLGGVMLATLLLYSPAASADGPTDFSPSGPTAELPQPPGGGYTDASGVAFNSDTGELLIVDNDSDEILIYDNDPNWTWDRTVALGGFGIEDLEGISWMGGNKYVVVDEFDDDGPGPRPNEIMVFTLNGSMVTELYRDTLDDLPAVDNKGPEGVAWVSSVNGVDEFFIVGETGTLWKATGQNGSVTTQAVTVNNTGVAALADFSDIGYFDDGGTATVYIANEDGVAGGRVRAYTVSGLTATRSGADLTPNLTQLEGIGFDPGATRMFLTGETNIELREYTRTRSVPSILGDVDCDGDIDEADALLVTNYDVGNVVAVQGCPVDPATQINIDAADANGDGNVDVVDALAISNCAAGNTGLWVFCPDTIWTLRNVVHGGYLRQDDNSDNVSMSSISDSRAEWIVTYDAVGVIFQNVATGRYLDADATSASGNIDTSAAIASDDHWTITDNGNAGLTIANVATGGWIDGDGIGTNIDQSTSVSADDFWEADILSPVAEPQFDPTVRLACQAAAGTLTWTDTGSDVYWFYRSIDGGANYGWIGRWKVTDAAPNPQTFTDPNFSAGNVYQVRQPGARATCSSSGPSLSCEAAAGALTWTDTGSEVYWFYRSTDGGASYSWIGRWKVTDAAPNPQTFTDQNFAAGNLYQVREPGARANCAEVG